MQESVQASRRAQSSHVGLTSWLTYGDLAAFKQVLQSVRDRKKVEQQQSAIPHVFLTLRPLKLARAPKAATELGVKLGLCLSLCVRSLSQGRLGPWKSQCLTRRSLIF